FAAEKMIAASGWYHRHCFRCFICSLPLDSTSVCDGPDSKIFCRVCYGRIRGNCKPQYFDESKIFTTTISGDESGDNCPRCGGRVFAAEMIASLKNVYHMKCFTCKECFRPLDKFISCDGPDGDVVCHSCYGRLYGCRSNGLSGGDMLKLLNSAIIKGSEADESTCPRCTGK
ncbi:CLUMA_CG020903_ isoform A, partial [Caligus rogercresseyi]